MGKKKKTKHKEAFDRKNNAFSFKIKISSEMNKIKDTK